MRVARYLDRDNFGLIFVFDEVAWEISASVVQMIIGTQQGTNSEFWVSVLNDVENKVKKSCNVFEGDALT